MDLGGHYAVNVTGPFVLRAIFSFPLSQPPLEARATQGGGDVGAFSGQPGLLEQGVHARTSLPGQRRGQDEVAAHRRRYGKYLRGKCEDKSLNDCFQG